MPKAKKYNYKQSKKAKKKILSRKMMIILLTLIILVPLTATTALLGGREITYRNVLKMISDFDYKDLDKIENNINSLPANYSNINEIKTEFIVLK